MLIDLTVIQFCFPIYVHLTAVNESLSFLDYTGAESKQNKIGRRPTSFGHQVGRGKEKRPSMQSMQQATKRHKPSPGSAGSNNTMTTGKQLTTIDSLCLNYIDSLRSQEETKKKEEVKALDEGGQWVSLTAQVFVGGNNSNTKWWAGAIPHDQYVAVKCAAANERSFLLPGKLARSPRYRPVRSPVHVELARTNDTPPTTALQCLDAAADQGSVWYADQWTASVDADAHMVLLSDAVMGRGLVAGKLFCSDACATFLEHAYRWIDNCLWLETHPPKDIVDNWHCMQDSVVDQSKHLAEKYDELCTTEDEETGNSTDCCDYDLGTFELTSLDAKQPIRGCSASNFLDSTEAREASSRIRHRTSFCGRCSTTHFHKLYNRQTFQTRVYWGAEALCIACALLLQRTEESWTATTEYWQRVASRTKLIPTAYHYLPDHWWPLPTPTPPTALKRVPASAIVDGVSPPRDTFFDDQWCQVLGGSRSSACRGGKTKLEYHTSFVYFGDDDNVTANDVEEYERRQLEYIVKDNYVSSTRLVACAFCMEAVDLAVRQQQFAHANTALQSLLCTDVLSVICLYVTSAYRETTATAASIAIAEPFSVPATKVIR